MADHIRFYFGQHVPGLVAQGLRRRGVDVLTAQDADRCSVSDADQLSLARIDERVLVTVDDDFLSLAAGGTPHSGIIFCAASKYSVGELIRALLLAHDALSPAEMRDHVEFL